MTTKAVGRRYAVTLLLSLGCLLASRPGWAHPLGNFSISHYTSLRVTQEAIELHYMLDLAEIPTFQELQEASLVPEVGHPSLTPYLTRQSDGLREGLRLEVNGQRLALLPITSEILFPPGAGGLPTMKLGFLYRAPYDAVPTDRPYHLHYRDNNFPGRAGWHEIVAVADSGVTLVQSSAPERDRSQALTDYPTDLLNSPPQVLEAVVLFSRGGAVSTPAAVGAPPSTAAAGTPSSIAAQTPAQPGTENSPSLALAANRQTTPRSAFTELITTQQLSAGVVLLALLVAAGLGALHALEPGHGKTVVAAYLVGTRGTARHAFYLGLIVTATHTAGVYLLGAVTLYASHYVVPERLYPWLGVFSGLIIAGLGGYLFLRRYAGMAQMHEHNHTPAHAHNHHAHAHAYAHSHAHAHAHGHESAPHQHAASDAHAHTQTHHHHAAPTGHHHHHLPGETVTVRELVTLGITGGIVPCPAALVVLLSAVAMHRIGFGLLLIVAFSVGLAAVLIAVGLLMVYARQFMTRFQGEGPLIRRWLPLTSAAAVTVFGVVMTLQALITAGVLQIRL